MQNKNHKATRKSLIVFVAVFSILLIGLIGLRVLSNKPAEQDTAVPATENTKSELSVTDLLNTVKSLKNDLVSALNDIKKNDLESAKKKIEAIPQSTSKIRTSIDYTLSLLNGSIPYLQEQLENVQALLNAADMATEEILLPAIDLLQAYPISELRAGDGFNTKLLCRYIDFAESVMPNIDILMECTNSVDLSLLDNDGKIAGYLNTANELMDIYHTDTTIFSTLKSMIGAEEDRLYLVAAQNSSEIRASGGYPGSIGTIRIQDGILTLGDFKTVGNTLSATAPKGIQITSEEIVLFNFLSGMQAPRDADLCPDFERVGQIWAAAYEEKNNEPVSGVITMTPHIVQRLLAAMDEEIELFDGLILNADNATKVLQHDIYFKYFSTDYVSNRGSISDQLFADAAEKTMKRLMENMTISDLLAYIPVAKESFDDRTLMLWMKDEVEQELIVKMGWSGGLNTDAENPETGIYFNCTVPSKMGWFLLMDTSIGERTKNENGSYTYPITVTFSNNITEEEIKSASEYITANLGGSIRGAAYFFAPAGGSISNFTASNGQTIHHKTYHALELGFMNQFSIRPNTPITVTYTVTTAPGVETPLTISKTPTAQ